MSFTDRLKNNPALVDELLTEIIDMTSEYDHYAHGLPSCTEEEKGIIRALVLSWAVRVEAASAGENRD